MQRKNIQTLIIITENLMEMEWQIEFKMWELASLKIGSYILSLQCVIYFRLQWW